MLQVVENHKQTIIKNNRENRRAKFYKNSKVLDVLDKIPKLIPTIVDKIATANKNDVSYLSNVNKIIDYNMVERIKTLNENTTKPHKNMVDFPLNQSQTITCDFINQITNGPDIDPSTDYVPNITKTIRNDRSWYTITGIHIPNISHIGMGISTIKSQFDVSQWSGTADIQMPTSTRIGMEISTINPHDNDSTWTGIADIQIPTTSYIGMEISTINPPDNDSTWTGIADIQIPTTSYIGMGISTIKPLVNDWTGIADIHIPNTSYIGMGISTINPLVNASTCDGFIGIQIPNTSHVGMEMPTIKPPVNDITHDGFVGIQIPNTSHVGMEMPTINPPDNDGTCDGFVGIQIPNTSRIGMGISNINPPDNDGTRDIPDGIQMPTISRIGMGISTINSPGVDYSGYDYIGIQIPNTSRIGMGISTVNLPDNAGNADTQIPAPSYIGMGMSTSKSQQDSDRIWMGISAVNQPTVDHIGYDLTGVQIPNVSRIGMGISTVNPPMDDTVMRDYVGIQMPTTARIGMEISTVNQQTDDTGMSDSIGIHIPTTARIGMGISTVNPQMVDRSGDDYVGIQMPTTARIGMKISNEVIQQTDDTGIGDYVGIQMPTTARIGMGISTVNQQTDDTGMSDSIGIHIPSTARIGMGISTVNPQMVDRTGDDYVGIQMPTTARIGMEISNEVNPQTDDNGIGDSIGIQLPITSRIGMEISTEVKPPIFDRIEMGISTVNPQTVDRSGDNYVGIQMPTTARIGMGISTEVKPPTVKQSKVVSGDEHIVTDTKSNPLYNIPLFEHKHIHHDAPETIHFSFVISSYNNQNNIFNNMLSIIYQTYSNWDIFYTNDCSTDNTDILFKHIVHKYNITNKVTYINNSVNMKQAYCKYQIYQMVKKNSVLIILDGDDWLSSSNVLNKLNDIYRTSSALFVYSGYNIYNNNRLSGRVKAKTYPTIVREKGLYRQSPHWYFSHLRTGYAWLFKLIPQSYLMMNNEWIDRCTDMAELFCVAEIAGKHTGCVNDIFCVYNKGNSVLHDNSYYNDATSIRRKQIESYIKTSTPIRISLPPFFIISLPDNIDGRSALHNQLTRSNIPGGSFFDAHHAAVEPDTVRLHAEYVAKYKAGTIKQSILGVRAMHLTLGALGICISTLRLFEYLNVNTELDHVCILEDDVYIKDDFHDSYQITNVDLQENDFIYIGHNSTNTRLLSIRQHPHRLIDLKTKTFNKINIYGAYSFICSKKFRSYVLNLGIDYIIQQNMPIDCLYISLYRDTQNGLNMKLFNDHLFIPEVRKDGIQQKRYMDFYNARKMNTAMYASFSSQCYN